MGKTQFISLGIREKEHQFDTILFVANGPEKAVSESYWGDTPHMFRSWVDRASSHSPGRHFLVLIR